MEKIFSIPLKLNFTPNTLGCYRSKWFSGQRNVILMSSQLVPKICNEWSAQPVLPMGTG